jgi:hypothetical protein
MVLQKSFVLVMKNSAGRTFGFRVRMWGTSSLHANRTGDFGNAIEGARSGIGPRVVFSRKIPSPATFDFCNTIGTSRTSRDCPLFRRFQGTADNDPLPLAQRPERIATLERDLDELHRVEEVLVAAVITAGQPVHRSPSAPPAAVLGVRVADRASRVA